MLGSEERETDLARSEGDIRVRDAGCEVDGWRREGVVWWNCNAKVPESACFALELVRMTMKMDNCTYPRTVSHLRPSIPLPSVVGPPHRQDRGAVELRSGSSGTPSARGSAAAWCSATPCGM
jgi:hypothetical protein